MRLNKIILFALAVSFLFITSSIAIVVNPPAIVRDFTSPGTYYHSSGNLAYFAVDHVMTFTQVVVDSTYVEFNNTKFNISSPNRINISLEYLDSDMTAASGITLVSFYAQTTTGNARFNISSFSVGATYEVFKNNLSMATPIANSTGFIYFTNSVWSTAYFEIALLSGVLPTVTTNASTGVEETNATLWGYVSSNDSTFIGFQYGLTASYGNSITYNVTQDYTYIYNNYFIKALTSGNGNFQVPYGIMDVLIVAGGGGSGKGRADGGGYVGKAYNGGGGGAGGLIWIKNITTIGGVFTYSVGAGGTGATSYYLPGNNGIDTIFGNLTAKGGGAGGSCQNTIGILGGSGGGAGIGGIASSGGIGTQSLQPGWSGIYGFGHNGSNSYTVPPDSWYGGGGGGAGSAGILKTGGIGINISTYFGTIFGNNGWFASGGGADDVGIDAITNSGMGGRARINTSSSNGRDGGSGIILIRFGNKTKNLSYNLNTLSPGTLYHYRAVATNSNGTSYGIDRTFLTKPNAPDTASFTITSNTRSLDLTWTKATGANTTLIVRKQGAYPLTKTDGTIVYNGTGSSYTNTGLTPGVGYGYRAWSYTSWGTTWQFSDLNASACEITKPEGATGGKASVLTIYLNSTMKVRLNWTKGTGANNTIVVRNTNHLPTSWTDGTMIYNGTGISNDIYMPYVPGSTEYYNAWSYAAWIINPHLYEISANATTFVMPGGGLLINCFDENDHHNLTFNVKVSNQSGSAVYENTSCTNTLVINATLCPQGANIQIIVSATGYHQRIYTLDIYTGIIYLLNARLPPETAPGNGTENCELRGYIDSMTITNPAIDAVVTLTYPLEDMISVEIYNASLYGTYGGWIFVASDKYSFTTTSVTINETVLDANTTMARVSYYYNFCEGGVESALYNLRVISESNAPIENAFMQVKRYINSTGTFVDVSSIFTDANGYVNIYLVPNAHYKVFISKTGYSDIIGSDYIPMSPNAYGQTDEKDFKLYRSTISDMWNYITYTIGPNIFDHNTSFDVYFNISCPSGILEWFKMTVTQYNSTTNTWITLWSFNETTMPTGGNLSYNINANGTYGVQCSFKLVGYDSYTFGVPGSGNKLIYTLMMWANAISNIDNTITNLAGRSPVFVGNVIVGYTALIVTSLLTLILFTFSPKFSGLGLVAVGMVTAWMKGPLNVISNATIGWNVVVIIIILGILVIAWTNMRETGGQT